MRNSMNPYGGVNPLIDKMIGNAYDVVKYVARYLKEIRYVAENMEHIVDAASADNKLMASGYSDPSGTLTITIPSEHDGKDISSLSIVATSGFRKFFPGPDSFHYKMEHDNVIITITSDDLWFVTFDCIATYEL